MIKMNPTISVIVPVYNVEKYLNECVDSILMQTFTDFEVILVDDGSLDGSGEICDRYTEKDDRVRVLHQENAGLSEARNTGIRMAQGRYICFVDSDDSIASEYCETLLCLLRGTDFDFSVCAVLRYPDGEKPQKNSEVTMTTTYSNTEFLRAQLERKSEFGVWNKLFRRELFDKLSFAAGKIHEDVIFSADLAVNCIRGVVVTSNQLYFYRQRMSSIVHLASQRCSSDRIYAGEYLIEATQKSCVELVPLALKYAVDYPWMFIDKIYVERTFRSNTKFIESMQGILRKYKEEYQNLDSINCIARKRMQLFAKSKYLYGFNAYSRLLRVYIYRLLKKDAYADGHGI